MKITKNNIFLSYIGFFTLGVSGVLVNILITTGYGIDTLGKFNFALSILIIFSQISALGLQHSVLKHHSTLIGNYKVASVSLMSALVLSFLFSLVFVCVIACVIFILEKKYTFAFLDRTIILVLPAVIFFALNKIILMSLNGLNKIKEYSFFNSMRYVVLLSLVCLFLIFSFNVNYLTVVLTLTELILFLLLTSFSFSRVYLFKAPDVAWMRRHLSHGFQGMWGGIFSELNTRVDAIAIGVLLDYKAVGVYSFASMIAEGFQQVYNVLRNNVDPLVGSFFHKREISQIDSTVSDVRSKYIPFVLLLLASSVFIYKPAFIHIFGMDQDVIEDSWKVYTMLIGFHALSSWYRPFIGIMNQIGRPDIYSCVVIVGVITNIILNIYLINVWGILGAAFSTGAVLFLESFILFILYRKMVLNEI